MEGDVRSILGRWCVTLTSLIGLSLLLLLGNTAEASQVCINPITSAEFTSLTGCMKSAGCIWYSETSQCRTGPYCNAAWTQSTCESIKYSGACEYVGGACQLKVPVDGTINRGIDCRGPCSSNSNLPCNFCGSEGVCCDVNNPSNACQPDFVFDTVANQNMCLVGRSTLCCARPAPPSPAPSQAPTTTCSTLLTQNACLKAHAQSCVWYGGTDGCQQSGYCNSAWSQATCERPLNQGTCVFSNGACVPRSPISTVINEGANCLAACGDTQAQCNYCGSAGVCCSRDSPANCRPNPTVCLSSYCCAQPGTWAPSAGPTRPPSQSPATSRPSQAPSTSPTRSPSTSRPSVSPSTGPTVSQPTSSPTISPTGAPSTSPTPQPSSVAPSLAPTRRPTMFGSVVEVVSTSNRFEPTVHASQAFYIHVCDIFTRYWFPSALGCDPTRLSVRIDPHDGGSGIVQSGRRILDTAPVEPNIDITFSTQTVPENGTAVSLGHTESNRELRRRIATAQFMIIDLDPSSVQGPPTVASGASSSGGALSTSAWIGIGVGAACFFLFLLLLLLILGRRRRDRRDSTDGTGYHVTGYQPRASRGYPESQSYRRGNMYIPQQPRDVTVVRGADFRTVPPTSKDYVAEEAGNVFVVSQKELPPPARTSLHRNGGGGAQPYDGDMIVASGGGEEAPPKPAKGGISRTLSQRSHRSEGQQQRDEDRKSLRRDSRRSNRSGHDEESGSDPVEYRSREESLYRHQMAPYFGGRSSAAGDDELDSLPAMPLSMQQQHGKRSSITSLASERTAPIPEPQQQSGSYRSRKYDDLVVYDTVNKNGMSDWI